MYIYIYISERALYVRCERTDVLRNDATWPFDIYHHLSGNESNYVVDGRMYIEAIYLVALSGRHKVTLSPLSTCIRIYSH